MKPYIITIARQYGSGGKTVGKMLAERLSIPFYNREIITMASEDSGVNAMLFSDERLKSDFIARLRARYRGDIPVPNDSSKSYLRDEARFSYQVKIIEDVSKAGTTVLLVEQNAKKALSLADRGYVLETGKVVKTGRASDLLNDDSIKKAYLGE